MTVPLVGLTGERPGSDGAEVSPPISAPSTSLVAELDKRVEAGLLRRQTKSQLAIYNYTDECTWSKAWDEYTLQARGLIVDTITGEVVARPFRKFFNLGEHETTQIQNLPAEPYEVFEKYDGSLGILYWHEGEPHIATRGSFTGDQAREGTKMLRALDVNALSESVTLLFEIVYPENRVSPGARLVVDYGDVRKLVLLGAVGLDGEERNRRWVEAMALDLGCEVATEHRHTIEEMIELQKVLPREREGFVVRFASGLRVKIKGEEYLRYQKLLNSLSPLSVWEAMRGVALPDEYYKALPEELHAEVREIEGVLRERYLRVARELADDLVKATLVAGDVLLVQPTPEQRKTLGLFLQANPKAFKHPRLVFPTITNKGDVVDKHIKELIRPTGNVLTKEVA